MPFTCPKLESGNTLLELLVLYNNKQFEAQAQLCLETSEPENATRTDQFIMFITTIKFHHNKLSVADLLLSRIVQACGFTVVS